MNLRKTNFIKRKKPKKKNSFKPTKRKLKIDFKEKVFAGRFKYRLLIDIQSTLSALKQSLTVIEKITQEGGTVLVVGTRKEYKPLLFNFGKETGHPFFTRWISGALTNWEVFADHVQKYGNRLDTLTLLDWQRKKLVIEFLKKYQGIIARPIKPSVVIFLNAQDLSRPVNESSVAEIPSIGLLNTRGNPYTLTYPIPANDSSLKVIGLFLILVKKAIKAGEAKRKNSLQRKSLIKKSSTVSFKNLSEYSSKKVKNNKISSKRSKKRNIKNKKK